MRVTDKDIEAGWMTDAFEQIGDVDFDQVITNLYIVCFPSLFFEKE